MLPFMSASLEALKLHLADVNALSSAIAIMDWDQQCLMPPGGGDARAEHVGALSRMAHEAFVSDEVQNLAQKAKAEVAPGSDDEALLRVVQRNLDIRTKIPAKLVAEKSKLAAIAHETWVKARANNDFDSFAPSLERMVEIAREEAEHLGYKDHIYDALTDQYEEGATKAYWDEMFNTIREPLVELVSEIKQKPQHDDSFLYGDWDKDRQKEFSLRIINAIGFDLDRGRLDTAPHPFCTGWSVGDIRLTTRYLDYLPSAIFGSLHEAGHGMYEQGTPAKWDRTALAGGVSLGFHESQSRTWENIVGRSEPFWEHFYHHLKDLFPVLDRYDRETFYKATNRVEPSFIRVEADEVTYNLHIMVRFEIECAMLTGELKVSDLPEFWNTKYQEYLGITPPNDAKGCLQDVHWSGGSIGYFPTYSMGNILSYQIWEQLEKTVGDTDHLIREGNFKPILDWLIENLYSKGSSIKPQDLLKQICGEGLNAEPYIRRIGHKYRHIYGIDQ